MLYGDLVSDMPEVVESENGYTNPLPSLLHNEGTGYAIFAADEKAAILPISNVAGRYLDTLKRSQRDRARNLNDAIRRFCTGEITRSEFTTLQGQNLIRTANMGTPERAIYEMFNVTVRILLDERFHGAPRSRGLLNGYMNAIKLLAGGPTLRRRPRAWRQSIRENEVDVFPEFMSQVKRTKFPRAKFSQPLYMQPHTIKVAWDAAQEDPSTHITIETIIKAHELSTKHGFGWNNNDGDDRVLLEFAVDNDKLLEILLSNRS